MTSKVITLIVFSFILIFQSSVFGSSTNTTSPSQVNTIEEDDEITDEASIVGKPISTLDEDDESMLDEDEDESE